MPRLLIVSHAPSEKTRLLTEAVVRGASHEDFDGLDVQLLSPFEATPEFVKQCNAIILGTTENFGYMSGAMKDFFDRIYYPCLEHTEALPWALFVRAGNDGSGAVNSIERIVTGLRWKETQPPVVCTGEWRDDFESRCEELGMTMAAGLELGIY